MCDSRLSFFHLPLQHLPVLMLLGLFIPGGLVGCGSSATKYYVLDAVAVKKMAVASNLPAITIRQLEIPPYLDRPYMVSRDQSTQLRIAEYHQWGGRLRDNLARTLADDLGTLLGSSDISAVPQPGSMDANIALLVDIRQFERLPDGYVHMKVRWQMQRAGEIVQRHLDHLSSSARMDSGDYAAMAQAMSALLGQLSEKMAKAIVQISSPGTD